MSGGPIRAITCAVIPPRKTLSLAVAAAVPLVVLTVAGGWLFGGTAAQGIVLGALAGSTAAFTRLSWAWKGALALAAAGSGIAGVLASAVPALVAALAGVAAIAQLPINIRAAGASTLLPVLVAVGATTPGHPQPAIFAGALLAGFAMVMALAALARVSTPARTIPAPLAVAHAVLVAALMTVATFAITNWDIPHGYWLVLTIAVVLRPVSGESGRAAIDRISGTLAGVVAAIAMVLVTPLWLALLLASACLVLTVAWSLSGDTRKQVMFTTPVVILASSSGLASAAAEAAIDRLLLTLAGAVSAALGSWLLHRADSQRTRVVSKRF